MPTTTTTTTDPDTTKEEESSSAPPGAAATTSKSVTFSPTTNTASSTDSNKKSSSKPKLYRTYVENEEPKIDAALKAYASWIMASSLIASTTAPSVTVVQCDDDGHDYDDDEQQHEKYNDPTEVLTLTRLLSKAINQHVVPITMAKTKNKKGKDVGIERTIEEEEQEELQWKQKQKQSEIIAQVWNNVVAMKQKPTKLLGRTALRSVWKDIDFQYDDSQQQRHPKLLLQRFVKGFERCLFQDTTTTTTTTNATGGGEQGIVDDETEDTARLIWDINKGRTELARRAANRQERAAANVKQREREQEQIMTNNQDESAVSSSNGPIIEELKEEGED